MASLAGLRPRRLNGDGGDDEEDDEDDEVPLMAVVTDVGTLNGYDDVHKFKLLLLLLFTVFGGEALFS